MRMKKISPLFLLFVALALNLAVSGKNTKAANISRSNFPADFIFGSASSAYQYEGGAYEGGRGPSIWDTFTKRYPEKIKDRSSGEVADNSYNLYKEDVAILKNIGFRAYRFSISWSRILPTGSLKGGVNKVGITYYNNLINELLSKGITPFITLFHWDTPQGLEDAYGGFRGSQIVNDFRDFADVCFREFGDRVKHWMTLNEPLTVVGTGYTNGVMAPGRCSSYVNPGCNGGDSATEPYIVGHNLLLAHAAAVKIYKDNYKTTQKGQVGIALNSAYTIPLSNSTADKAAASRAMAFSWDWFMEPLVTGNYPSAMVNRLKTRLPQFTSEQSSMLKGSIDFVGVNYYSSNYAADSPCPTENLSMASDSCSRSTVERNGILIGPKAASDWLLVYPRGIKSLLLYVKKKFNNPVMYITENGVDEASSDKIFLDDGLRINYYSRHLIMVQKAIEAGANVKGYFAWSLLDNFEWADGYTVRFGLVYVDYKNGAKRILKNSAKWFKGFLNA